MNNDFDKWKLLVDIKQSHDYFSFFRSIYEETKYAQLVQIAGELYPVIRKSKRLLNCRRFEKLLTDNVAYFNSCYLNLFSCFFCYCKLFDLSSQSKEYVKHQIYLCKTASIYSWSIIYPTYVFLQEFWTKNNEIINKCDKIKSVFQPLVNMAFYYMKKTRSEKSNFINFMYRKNSLDFYHVFFEKLFNLFEINILIEQLLFLVTGKSLNKWVLSEHDLEINVFKALVEIFKKY